MGILSTPAIYGAARALDDAEDRQMRRQAFQSDQAIRDERLRQETDLAPIRKRALELGVADAEHQIERRPAVEAQQDALAGINLDIAKFNKEDQEKIRKEAEEARRKRGILNDGLRNFAASGDPQAAADAISQLQGPDGPKYTATRGEDGSITMNGPANKPLVFRNINTPQGPRTADEQLQYFMMYHADPIKQLEQKYKSELDTDKEAAKQGAITTRELGKARIRADDAEARAGRERDRRITRELKDVRGAVSDGLKTSSIPGHFANVYSSEDDAKLAPTIHARAAEIYKAGADDEKMTPAEAARRSIEETRTNFVTQKKAAIDAATKLLAAGIDPTDQAQVQKALDSGNGDAKKLISAIGAIKNKYGADVARYLFEQLPRKKK